MELKKASGICKTTVNFIELEPIRQVLRRFKWRMEWFFERSHCLHRHTGYRAGIYRIRGTVRGKCAARAG